MKRNENRPKVIGTKASLARAKTIKSQLTGTVSKPINRKRKAPEEPETLAKSYKTTVELLNERPSWDIRGQMKDLNHMYDLNSQRLEDILKFKRELEILNDEKESQEKDALQKAATLRTQLQEMERNHATKIEDLHAQQRIEYQKLEDDSVNFNRKLATIEIEVSDAKRNLDIETDQLAQLQQKNDVLRASIQETSKKFEDVELENRTLDKEIKALELSISKNEKEIESREKENATIDSTYEKLNNKLTGAYADRDRLVNKIKELEEKKKK